MVDIFTGAPAVGRCVPSTPTENCKSTYFVAWCELSGTSQFCIARDLFCKPTLTLGVREVCRYDHQEERRG